MERWKPAGVFSFEGDWEPDDLTYKASVRPILAILEQVWGGEFIHRRIGTKEELGYYVNKWLQKDYDSYTVGYFAFHGARRVIHLGGDSMTLDQLAEMINENRNGAAGRVIYLGTCSTLGADEQEIKQFCKATRAKAVVGYTKAVYWIESAAFELLLLETLTQYESMGWAKKKMNREYGELAERLGMRFVTQNQTR